MNWLSIGKGIVGVVTSIGVGNVIGNVVKATTPINVNQFNKIAIGLGSFIISGIVADQATNYVNTEIDKIFAPVTKEENLPTVAIPVAL